MTKVLLNVGAPMPIQDLKNFLSFHLIINETYGLSETTGPVFSNTPNNYRIGSVGKLSGIEAKIDEADSTGIGEILLRDRPIYMGYLHDTNDKVTKDRWFYSGCWDHLDKDNYLFVEDVESKRDDIISPNITKITKTVKCSKDACGGTGNINIFSGNYKQRLKHSCRIEVTSREAHVCHLKDSLQASESIRRGLHNQLQDGRWDVSRKGNVRVFCRVRPLTKMESENGPVCLLYDPGMETISLTLSRRKLTHDFTFDKVFCPQSSQDAVYSEISQLVQSVLDGYNVCVFTYRAEIGQKLDRKQDTQKSSSATLNLVDLAG
uniref:Kinesin motor domain-containing protein n=1 Tax=Strigamia maritima TaxID=126957 RepID=T1J770_STRMM